MRVQRILWSDEILPYLQIKLDLAHPILEAHAYKITNSKHQITKRSQIPIINDQMFGNSNFGHWNLFDISNLGFGSYNNPDTK